MTNASIPWTPLRAAVIREHLRAQGLDGPVVVTDQTSSTQDDALEGMHAGAPHGSVFAAESQTQGRGRQGRRWLTTLGGLLFSVVVRTEVTSHSTVGRLTVGVVVGVARAIQRCAGAAPCIKWPNDLLLGEAKAGGVLVETQGSTAVIGVGLNAFNAAGVAEGQATTTVAAYATRPFERNELLAACVVEVLDCLGAEGAAWDDVFAEWVRRSVLLERDVEVAGSVSVRGRVEGFEPDGALRLRDAAGNVWRINSGEVSLRLATHVEPRCP